MGGTNGKGSTAAFLRSILMAAGYRVGLYTQPHLHRLNERLTINGEPVSDAVLVDLLGELRPWAANMASGPAGHPTAFELVTAAMYRYFAAAKVDLVIQEVGMGGRWDATNVVPAPLVAVVTNVSVEHTRYLGNTPEAIAAEKAGIIKAGSVAVTGCQGKALDVVARECAARSVPLVVAADAEPEIIGPRDGDPAAGQPGSVQGVYWRKRDGGPTPHLDYRGIGRNLENLELSLRGDHQLANGTVAVAASELLATRGYPVSDGAIRTGLATASWPGRLEQVGDSPPVFLDGAHNPAGALVLARSLADMVPGPSWVVVFGVLEDKDYREMVRSLAGCARTLILTRPPDPRGLDPDLVAAGIGVLQPPPEPEVIPDPVAAMSAAFREARGQHPICVCGSFTLVGGLRPWLQANDRWPRRGGVE